MIRTAADDQAAKTRLAEWEARMFTRYRLKPDRANAQRPHCPWVIAGRRCRTSYRDEELSLCLCQRSRLFDHTHRWIDAKGYLVLTLEPYQIDGEDFAALISAGAPLGLDIHIEGYSPYYPGESVLIMIERDRTPA